MPEEQPDKSDAPRPGGQGVPAAPPDGGTSEDRGVIPLEPKAEDAIPTARPATRAPTGPTSERGSILHLASDACPNCAQPMEDAAVVCMSCGYDLKANRVIAPTTGMVEVEPTRPGDARPEFVRPGGTPKVVGALGGIVLATAGVSAGFAAPTGSGWVVTGAMVVLAVYSGILHTATGVAAVWCASKYVGERFTRIDLVAARMLLAFATFVLVLNLPVHLPYEWLDKGVKLLAAVGVYFLMLMALFRRDRRVSLVLLGMHAGIWVFVQIGVLLGVVLQSMANQPAGKP